MRLCMATVMFACSISLAGDAPPAEVLRAARDGLERFVNKAMADQSGLYGLPAGANVEEFRLDGPWRQFVLPPETVLAANSSVSTANEAILATDNWFFPVTYTGCSRALLVVGPVNGEWQSVALGYAGLARELERVRDQWPERKGYHARLVTSFQAQRHLFTIPEVDSPNMTLLQIRSADAAPFPDYRRLDSPAAVMDQLKAAVQANLSSFRKGVQAP